MRFKNLTLLRLVEPFPFTAETQAAWLERYALQLCHGHQHSATDWTALLSAKAIEFGAYREWMPAAVLAH